MKRFIFLLMLIVSIPVICGFYAMGDTQKPKQVIKSVKVYPDFNLDTWVDPMGESKEELVVEEKPKEDLSTVKLIGRIAEGIKTVKGNYFWICGKKLEDKDRDDTALSMAYHIVKSSQGAGFNPWGVAGTMANESGFDPCALGLNPRKWAVKNGLLDEKWNGLYQSKESVLRVVRDERANKYFKRSGFDLGLCQVLTRFYPTEVEDLLTIEKGIQICVTEMGYRSQKNKTKNPWLYWKGTNPTYWYAEKVRRWARKMGARKGEI